MPKVIYEKDGRIGRITLNRPDVMNAIDDDVPVKRSPTASRAPTPIPDVHVIVLSGAGAGFCAGYDLTYYAQSTASGIHRGHSAVGPDEGLRLHDAQHRAVHEPVALVSAGDLQGARLRGRRRLRHRAVRRYDRHEHDAQIGYMPTRVWGCPTTAMWVYRLGPERAKRMLFTGDKITGVEASARPRAQGRPAGRLDAEVEALAERMATCRSISS